MCDHGIYNQSARQVIQASGKRALEYSGRERLKTAVAGGFVTLSDLMRRGFV